MFYIVTSIRKIKSLSISHQFTNALTELQILFYTWLKLELPVTTYEVSVDL